MKKSAGTQRSSVDAAYRRATGRIGLVMVIFVVLFAIAHSVFSFACERLAADVRPRTAIVMQELFDSAAYLLSFLAVALLLRRMTPRDERRPMLLAPALPQGIWLLLPAGFAVIYAAIVVNGFVIQRLGLAPADVSQGQWIAGMPIYEGVLLYFATVIVPAFCEELLFRGALLSTLLPYGRTTAILGSAILFGLMHQDAEQIIYTTVAGVVIAYITLASGSLWYGVLLHMLVNLFAVVEVILYQSLTPATALSVFSLLEVIAMGGGLVCLVVLIAKGNGCHGENTRAEHLPQQPIRGFFVPWMIAFVVLCVVQMLLLILLNLL